MSEAKQISLRQEQTIDSLMAEIKAHITTEVNGLRHLTIERPMSAKESADFLKINIKTFYKWIKEGVLPHEVIHYVGSNIMCYASQLDKFVKTH